MSPACLLLFAKAPEPGRVKTRLCPPLTHVQAASLYRAFLQDIAQTASQLPEVDFILAYAGDPAPLAALVGDQWHFIEQQGEDLGERLNHASERAFTEGYERVVIIGSDSPGLPSAILQQALDALASHEVVLGPSVDGGYYLVGLGQPDDVTHRWLPRIFEQIAWSTEHVFDQTLARLDSNCRLHLLPPWYDVDTVRELRFLKTHLRGRSLAGEPVPQHTTQMLRDLAIE